MKMAHVETMKQAIVQGAAEAVKATIVVVNWGWSPKHRSNLWMTDWGSFMKKILKCMLTNIFLTKHYDLSDTKITNNTELGGEAFHLYKH